MQGPTAAVMSAGSAPSRIIAPTAAFTIPPSAPRQPAWAAATTRALGSAISTGAQSAARAPHISPAVPVATASASGRRAKGASAVTARAEWIW